MVRALVPRPGVSSTLRRYLQVQGQAVPQGPVLLGQVVGQQQRVHDAEQQLLGFGCGQQGAPVLHYTA